MLHPSTLRFRLKKLDLKRPRVFACWTKDKKGNKILLELVKPYDVKLVRYYKIKGDANPYDPKYAGYFAMRSKLSNVRPV